VIGGSVGSGRSVGEAAIPHHPGTASSPGTASTTAATSSVIPYPLDTCIVTDNRLGSMGRPITKVYQGQEVKFCCAPCVEEFEESPEKFLAKLP
jgi:hypothetical protein